MFVFIEGGATMNVFPAPYFLLLGKNTLLEIQTNSLKPIC